MHEIALDVEAAEEIPTSCCARVSWWAGRQIGLRLNALLARQCCFCNPGLYPCQALLLPLRKTGQFSPGLGLGSTEMLCAWHSPKALQCLQLQTHLPHGPPNWAVTFQLFSNHTILFYFPEQVQIPRERRKPPPVEGVHETAETTQPIPSL